MAQCPCLICRSSTVNAESSARRKPITGHIDVVQVRNGFIHLLDYKPNAATINPVNQLIIYALAFAARTRLPVRMFKCAWFDEKDYFEFFPLQAVWTRTPLPIKSRELFQQQRDDLISS